MRRLPLVLAPILTLGCASSVPHREVDRLSARVDSLTAEIAVRDVTTTALADSLARLQGQVGWLADAVWRLTPKSSLRAYGFGDTVTLCGHEFDLTNPDIRERFEREFYWFVEKWGQTILFVKRSGRAFPFIETALRDAGLCDDLKYVIVVESEIRAEAYSPAKASGWWQFIPSTAKRYELRVSSFIDERRDPRKATRAAIAYISDLLPRFDGDVLLALAAYNYGEGNVDARRVEQGEDDYVNLYLNSETGRYVFRILAVKYVFEHLEKLGLSVPFEDRYWDPTEECDVQLASTASVRQLADAAHCDYRSFRQFNPWIVASRLPPGRYAFRIPPDGRDSFAVRFPCAAGD